MTRAELTPAATALGPARRATSVAFIGLGFTFATWASRIPQVKEHLHLQPSELGLVLFALAGGSIIALPLSGRVITKLGSRRTVAASAGLLAVGLAGAGVGYLFGVVPVVAGLFVLGIANGTWDVAMNVQAAVVEQRAGRSIMSRFHAGFSVGTVAGALVGAAMVGLHVPVTAHLAAVAVLVGAVVAASVRAFLPDQAAPTSPVDTGGPVRPRTAWTEPRTLLVGVFVLAFAFAEGTGTDWIAVASIDGYHVTPVVGTLAFAVFLAAMTTGRWTGPALLDRHGRVSVVRATAGLAVLGSGIFVLSGSAPGAFLGVLLWGAGVSLGFPVGMSAAADDPARAPARVSVVASIGYGAFLLGPPLIGFLGERVTVHRAITAVAVMMALAAVIASSVRPLPSDGDAATGPPRC